ncbi:hypothetical protein AALA78_13205 [Lachnospiraceae bacterium 42-17]
MLKEEFCPKYSEIFLKHLIFFALFLPIYYSEVDSVYYPNFILVNFFGILVLVSLWINRGQKFRIIRKNIFELVFFIGIILYNMSSFYMNYRYLWWYEDQINITISLLFFLGLLLSSQRGEKVSDRIIDFLIYTIVVSNIGGVICYFTGHYGISVENAQIRFIPIDPTYYESRFNWIYGHKNNYGFMLIVFIALFVIYRKRFRNKWTYWGSIGVMYVGLVISHSYTSLFSSFLIFGGQIIDYLVGKKIKLKKKYFLITIPVFGLAGVFVVKMMRERNVLSLGSRIPIWKESIKLILQSPRGIGTAYDTFAFSVPGLNFDVYNCHNMFLTFMWRFSILVGLCYIFIYIVLIVGSLRRNFSFLSFGIWGAFIVPMFMDSTVLTTQLTIFLFILYCIFFRKKVESNYEIA